MTDQHGIDGRIVQNFFAGSDRSRDSASFGYFSCGVHIEVSNGHGYGFWDSKSQALRVYPADAAGTDDSDSEFRLRQARLLLKSLREILFDRAQILTIARRAIFRRAHSRQDILLHQNVAL